MDPLSAVQIGLGAIKTVGGLIAQSKARKRMDKLQSQRQAYKTPEEVFQILQATQQNAQSGLGAETLRYLTGQNDRALSTSINSANLLGGDPNDLGALLERSMQQSMAIAGQDTAMRMENFGKYLGAVNTVADNRAAEQISRDNILKDQIQGASAEGGDATKNLQGGLNSILAGGAGQFMSGLYNQNQEYQNFLGDYMNTMTGAVPTGNTGGTVANTGATRSTTNSTTVTPRGN